MEIAPFEPGMAAGVAACYNDLVAGVPHCSPVAADEFVSLERLAFAACREETVLVARRAGSEILGFVHTGVAAPPTEDWHPKDEPGIIRFLAYRPGQRAVGHALLQAAETWLRERGRLAVMAWSNDYSYPFYHLPVAHLSDRIAHAHPLFALGGYGVAMSELLFEWPDFEPPTVRRPGFDLDVAVEWRDSIAIGARVLKPALVVRAMRGDQEAGRCEIAGLGRATSRADAAGWCFCDELFVAEPLRGRGLGKFLLAAALAEMHQAGFRHAAISTDWNNYRAALFYANFGYSLCDRTFAFRKEMGDGSA